MKIRKGYSKKPMEFQGALQNIETEKRRFPEVPTKINGKFVEIPGQSKINMLCST